MASPQGSERRKELRAEYRRAREEAGVYRIVNGATGRSLVASAVNLRSAQNRFEFAFSSDSVGALDGRLAPDVRAHGMASLSFEVLESVQPPETLTASGLRQELKLLEGLWRERLGPDSCY
jgi:hypothetical protein